MQANEDDDSLSSLRSNDFVDRRVCKGYLKSAVHRFQLQRIHEKGITMKQGGDDLRAKQELAGFEFHMDNQFMGESTHF